MMEVNLLQKKDESAWDEYVLKSRDSTFYHQIGWRNVIEKTYGHKPIYIVAKENDEFKGILPLFLMKNIFLGRKLVSIPFASYGGVCSENKIIEIALIEEAKRITDKYDANCLELRDLDMKETDLVSNNSYFTSILELKKDPEIIWDNCRKSMRRYVRKSMDNKLQITRNSKKIDEFYNLYCCGMHELGTPPHDFAFFNNLSLEFPKNINIVTVNYNDNPIGALFLLFFRDTVIYGWGASLEKYLYLSPNYLLFWEAIKDSCENGYSFFDFGRSQQNTGIFKFKSGWGAVPRQLDYKYYYRKKQNIDTAQSNPNRQKFAKVWKKIPLPLANLLGPKIRRNLP